MKVRVIEKKKGQINRTTGEEIKGELRVTAYARVSTDDEDQRNSYQTQLMYFKMKIKENKEWIYVDMLDY